MKRKSSKEILAESFREIAERKNIDKITVRDITENCGYSSSTFYRQFRDRNIPYVGVTRNPDYFEMQDCNEPCDFVADSRKFAHVL